MKSSRGTDYAKPDTAIASYLDDLLQTAVGNARESESEAPAADKPAAPAPAVTESVNTPVAPAPARRPARSSTLTGPAVRPAIAKTGTARPAPARPVVLASDSAPLNTAPVEPSSPPLRPDWSKQPFECLLFRVAGLQLAVPLVLLGAIHRINGKVKSIPGRPHWYMGMLPDASQNLKVVDSGEWIMAGRVPPDTRANYRFVIRLDNSEWALACDDVAQSFTLDPDEVKWRSGRSKRPWLAGTVIQHMCALIDVGTMASMLARAERENRLALE